MKIAVITGASSGVGREFVRAVDARYELDEIWVIARREDRLTALQELCRNKLRPVVLDLTDEKAAESYASLLEETKPEIMLLMNAAGCGVFGAFAEQEIQKVLRSVQLNSMALTAVCHASLPYMSSGSAIVNVSSNSAWQPVPYLAVYGASKSYVLSFSRALGRELKPRGIHVMSVCPGWIKTEFQQVAGHYDYVRYVDHWYTPEQVAEQAMKDLAKMKTVSILGAPVRRQVRLVKFLPVKLIMEIWCRQQGYK